MASNRRVVARNDLDDHYRDRWIAVGKDMVVLMGLAIVWLGVSLMQTPWLKRTTLSDRLRAAMDRPNDAPTIDLSAALLRDDVRIATERSLYQRAN